MKYYNEATAEMVSGVDMRKGVIPVVKTISPRDTCQSGHTSSEKLTILKDNLEIDKVVKLNYIAEKDYLLSNGYKINERVLRNPCIFISSRNGLKLKDCSTFPDAEKTEIFEIGEDIHLERRELYFAYSTSFVVHKVGDYDIINSLGSKKVYIQGSQLMMENSILADLEHDTRHLVTVFKVRGIWKDYYYNSRTTMFTIVVLGDTIVGVGVDIDNSDTDFSISTYSDGLETYSSTGYNFHPSESMPGTLSHDENRMSNPWWANNMTTYESVYSKMGPVLNKVCGIISDSRGECR